MVAAARPPATKLLPEETVVFLSVADAPELAERFMNTALGQMSQDPQLKGLVEQLHGSLAEAVTSVQDRIGLSLPELLALPQGEVTLAVVAPEEEPPAVVMLVDVGNQLSGARKLIQHGTEELDKSGAAKSEETVAGTKFIIYDGVGPRKRKAVYFEKDATIVIGSNPEVLKRLLAAWNGEEVATLSDNQRFAAIVSRSRGSKGEEPQMIWYVDPIGLMGSIGQRSTQVRLAVAMLPALGLDGLTAIGGSIAMDAGQFDSIAHTHLLLENPRSGVLGMIALEPGPTAPERWVPDDVATYTTVHWDLQSTYTTLATLYDSFRAEGAFAKMIERRVLKPTGIDFQIDLLPRLEGRLTYITWIERPIRPTSPARLLAVKLLDAAAVADVLKKAFEKNKQFLSRQAFAGRDYYQVERPRRDDGPADLQPPKPCFGILDDYLVMADRASFFHSAVTTSEGSSKSLAEALDFKLIASKIRRRSGGTKPAMISFSRPEENMRFMYEMALSDRTRQGLSKRAEKNAFFKSLDSALQANPLPPFPVIQRYLAPGGAMVVDDETGIHYTGFSLRRKLD